MSTNITRAWGWWDIALSALTIALAALCLIGWMAL